ncbi:ester cyclase [Thalassovita taeanensis]|uniref:Ketosteroid isomerase-related protein n=1 Tax=Thalassovita taeanensis TaxID=657014 RepID=A0A1H9J9P8_9RHOB|nr:nuclear transport factor 2 family protein [Thalassovita taeanensis]SEQ83546.1 Ketosteroid isomerase-related protein [Thalassovita taeanensis]
MTNSDILREWYARVWEKGDLSAVDELFVPDATADGLVPEMEVGTEEFKILVATIQELITLPRVSVEKTVEQDNWVSGFMTMQAETQDKRKPVHVSGMVLCRIDDGKIVETYNAFDFVGFFEQLGLLPANTIALCMSGVEIG